MDRVGVPQLPAEAVREAGLPVACGGTAVRQGWAGRGLTTAGTTTRPMTPPPPVASVGMGVTPPQTTLPPPRLPAAPPPALPTRHTKCRVGAGAGEMPRERPWAGVAGLWRQRPRTVCVCRAYSRGLGALGSPRDALEGNAPQRRPQ